MQGKNDISRFRQAQSAGVYERALAEIEGGMKSGCWMWFIFPQIAGLGQSEISRHYAIANAEEARAYLADPVLGSRLRQICEALLNGESSDAHQIFGTPDDLKLRSSMTLFDFIRPQDIFAKVLDKFYSGQHDRRTLELLDALPDTGRSL